jgi:hypothetical protein
VFGPAAEETYAYEGRVFRDLSKHQRGLLSTLRQHVSATMSLLVNPFQIATLHCVGLEVPIPTDYLSAFFGVCDEDVSKQDKGGDLSLAFADSQPSRDVPLFADSHVGVRLVNAYRNGYKMQDMRLWQSDEARDKATKAAAARTKFSASGGGGGAAMGDKDDGKLVFSSKHGYPRWNMALTGDGRVERGMLARMGRFTLGALLLPPGGEQGSTPALFGAAYDKLVIRTDKGEFMRLDGVTLSLRAVAGCPSHTSARARTSR